MDAGHDEIGLFDAFDIYDRAQPFFRGRDAYSYASGFAAAMEGMGYRIEWCHDEGMGLWINAVTREERDAKFLFIHKFRLDIIGYLYRPFP